jgi:phospholipid N-methyltransferase
MVSCIDITDIKHIVELWGGSGIVTAQILNNIGKNVKLDVFEIDEDQVEKLRTRFQWFQNVMIHHLSAAHIDTIVESGSIDVVISTLPLWSISIEGVDHILRTILGTLRSRGQYIQYQYWMVNRKDVKKYFTIVSTLFEPRNIGPAWIYNARKIEW